MAQEDEICRSHRTINERSVGWDLGSYLSPTEPGTLLARDYEPS